jgi:hypothetical protein
MINESWYKTAPAIVRGTEEPNKVLSLNPDSCYALTMMSLRPGPALPCLAAKNLENGTIIEKGFFRRLTP